jgi:hypothetical protein
MTDEELKKSWAVSKRHLAASRYCLPQHLEGEALETSKQMEHFLHHNEFGLALDEAEALGKLCEAGPAFWNELRLAAENMGMDDAAVRLTCRLPKPA